MEEMEKRLVTAESEIALLKNLQEILEANLVVQAKLIATLIASHPRKENFLQEWSKVSAHAWTKSYFGLMGKEEGEQANRQQVRALFQQTAYENWASILKSLQNPKAP